MDKDNARRAGQALFEAVDKLVRRMPYAQQPTLVVFDETLGSPGGEAPFMNLNNVVTSIDGAFVVQRTDVQQHHLDPTGRDPRSWFNARTRRETDRRSVYLQHASNPIAR